MRAATLVLIGAMVMAVAPAHATLPPREAATTTSGSRSIDFVGVGYDEPDLARLGVGQAGFWFPQFDAGQPVSDRPTGENVRTALPEWTAPLNHWGEATDVGCSPEDIAAGCLPTFFFRSFSQDGPARSAGGHPAWSLVRLPNGESGRSGAVVDPHTQDNRNNTINRVQLRGTVPRVFYVSVVTDNTARQHDPTRALLIRGNAGTLDTDATQIESASEPTRCELTFNAKPDVYTFRVTGFRDGDYLKLRLAADTSVVGGASFGGLLFDEHLDRRGAFRRVPTRGSPSGC